MRDEFFIDRKGVRMVLYAGLLDEAHRQGLRGIDTYLIQAPTQENGEVAVVHATVEMDDAQGGAKRFQGVGDASPDNVGKMIRAHLIRMAETRAKARALRDAINVGVAILEDS